jgi:hypothetical protein
MSMLDFLCGRCALRGYFLPQRAQRTQRQGLEPQYSSRRAKNFEALVVQCMQFGIVMNRETHVRGCQRSNHDA